VALDVSWKEAAFSLGRSDTAALDGNASLSGTSHHVQILPPFSILFTSSRLICLKTLHESWPRGVVMFPECFRKWHVCSLPTSPKPRLGAHNPQDRPA
jgi:hypothetical protein